MEDDSSEGGGDQRDRTRDTGERTTAGPAVGSDMSTEPVALVVFLAKHGRLDVGPFAPSFASLVTRLSWGRGRASRRRRTDKWTDGQGTAGEQSGVSDGQGRAGLLP